MGNWKDTGIAILGEVIDLGVDYLKTNGIKKPSREDITSAMATALDGKRAALADALATEVFAAIGRGAEQVRTAMEQAEALGRARGAQTFRDSGATYEEWDGKKEPIEHTDSQTDPDAVTTQKIPRPED